MIKRTAIALLFLCAAALPAAAQHTLRGRIEYERKTNLHKLWEGNEWLESFRDKMPPFVSSYFNLAFTEQQSHYTPGRETEQPKIAWGLPPGSDNDIQQDYSSGRVTAAKNIYEEHFLIQDSAARHQWRIGSELRSIAGYQCRKAVTRICDSVYVVAFYTDEIPVSGGPEQMSGLPGMILELAVPRLFTTWVATKVELVSIPETALKAPVKGKPVTHAALEAKLRASLKDWGKNAQRNIWWSAL